MSNDNDNLTGSGWLVIAVLLAFLAASIGYSVYAWGAIGATHISGFGWFALIAGSLITLAVGGGLMALVFYSSRNDYDR